MKYFKSFWFVVLFLVGSATLAGCATIPVQEITPAEIPSPVKTPILDQNPYGDQPPTQEVALPSPTEENFSRDTIYLELAELQMPEGQSGLVLLPVEGQLPTPCHQFASAICPACAVSTPNLIEVNVYSIIEAGRECRGPTTPFEQDIPLGVYTEGVHSVSVNGQHVGSFDASKLEPKEAFLEMARGTVLIENTNVVLPNSESEQVLLTLQGYLPTPCNVFQADVSAPDAENQIQVEAYSLAPVDQVCIDIVQDFTTDVPLGMLPPGTYSIWLNGEAVGEVNVP